MHQCCQAPTRSNQTQHTHMPHLQVQATREEVAHDAPPVGRRQHLRRSAPALMSMYVAWHAAGRLAGPVAPCGAEARASSFEGQVWRQRRQGQGHKSHRHAGRAPRAATHASRALVASTRPPSVRCSCTREATHAEACASHHTCCTPQSRSRVWLSYRAVRVGPSSRGLASGTLWLTAAGARGCHCHCHCHSTMWDTYLWGPLCVEKVGLVSFYLVQCV